MQFWQADTFLNEICISTEIWNGEMSDQCVTLANINVSASTFCEPWTRMGMRRINPCLRGWACDGENPSRSRSDQAQVQALYSSDMPVSEPVWWGIPCKFSFWVFQLWIGGILTVGYRKVELWLVWLMFWEEALTPSESDIPMCDLFWRGYPVQIFILHFPCWNWKKNSMTWHIQ